MYLIQKFYKFCHLSKSVSCLTNQYNSLFYLMFERTKERFLLVLLRKNLNNVQIQLVGQPPNCVCLYVRLSVRPSLLPLQTKPSKPKLLTLINVLKLFCLFLYNNNFAEYLPKGLHICVTILKMSSLATRPCLLCSNFIWNAKHSLTTKVQVACVII